MNEYTKDGLDLYYLIKIDALKLYEKHCIQNDEYERAEHTDLLRRIVEDAYKEFYLKEYESKLRVWHRDYVYKEILGYMPYNPRQIK